MAPPPASPPARPAAPRRLWLYRLGLAVGVPLVLFAALEAGLRLAHYGRASTFLIPDDQPGYLRSNPEFASLFLPGNFDLRPLNFRLAAKKPANTVRIVVLGESAAQGVPVPAFGFAPQVRAQLRAHYPGKEIEVINTGIVAINSHVVYQVAREMARYEPDLFLVYMGNNEVVGPYGPGCAYLSQMPPLWVIRASVWVRSLRTGQLLGTLLGRLSAHVAKRAEWGGMSMFVNQAVAGDDPRLEAVYGNFSANLRGIVAAADGAGAKVVLCTVVGNLADCAPFVSLHRPGLSAADLMGCEAEVESGWEQMLQGRLGLARHDLEAARATDPHYAETSFLLGSVELRDGHVEAARRLFVEALHWDALRFRPDPRINEIVRAVAAEHPGQVVLVDTALDLGGDPASTVPPVGSGLLFEHVHFNWAGNARAAALMARGSARALSGADAGAGDWLSADAAAAALAFTPHEQEPMLLRIDVLTRKPPFTNQRTYVRNEAMMARRLDEAAKAQRDPAVLAQASRVAETALERDPENPALAGILEGIRLDQGDLTGALGLADRVGSRLPRDYALTADEASILIGLGRVDEAGRLLAEAGRSGADLDLLAPVLVAYWTKTKRYSEGIDYLTAAVARRPTDLRLQVVRAGLRRASGDAGGAEREFRAALATDPTSEDALEAVISLMTEAGQSAAAAQFALDSAPGQPRNQANNLRASQACEGRGDAEGSIRFLLAAERSGPVTSTFELSLALKYYQLSKGAEMMKHLVLALDLARDEANPAVTASIEQLIQRMTRQFGAGQNRE
jgi:Tfp pilus assembly protein PilF